MQFTSKHWYLTYYLVSLLFATMFSVLFFSLPAAMRTYQVIWETPSLLASSVASASFNICFVISLLASRDEKDG